MNTTVQRARLDQLLVDKQLVESREKAQQVIRAGSVSVDGQLATKPGHRFPVDAALDLATPPPYVGRGGEKLAAAFDAFPLVVDDCVCLDVGASTGGFTDCLLQKGARRVYAVDVGKGQLHWKLRNDPRVVVYEGCNARALPPDFFPEQPQVAVCDVSFISLTKILPAITNSCVRNGQIVTLIKPQFEARRADVCRGGVVRDAEVRSAVVAAVKEFGERACGLHWLGQCESPLKGPAGNIEYLAYWRTP